MPLPALTGASHGGMSSALIPCWVRVPTSANMCKSWYGWLILFTALFLAAWGGASIRRITPEQHKVPKVAPCQMLFRHIASQDELIMLLLARPECGAQFTKAIRDSLGIEVARN